VFHDTGFGSGITGGEEMNGLESLSQFSIGKFFALIRLYAYGTLSVFKDVAEGSDHFFPFSDEWVLPKHTWITRRWNIIKTCTRRCLFSIWTRRPDLIAIVRQYRSLWCNGV
jgi:hypothetical protein